MKGEGGSVEGIYFTGNNRTGSFPVQQNFGKVNPPPQATVGIRFNDQPLSFNGFSSNGVGNYNPGLLPPIHFPPQNYNHINVPNINPNTTNYNRPFPQTGMIEGFQQLPFPPSQINFSNQNHLLLHANFNGGPPPPPPPQPQPVFYPPTNLVHMPSMPNMPNIHNLPNIPNLHKVPNHHNIYPLDMPPIKRRKRPAKVIDRKDKPKGIGGVLLDDMSSSSRDPNKPMIVLDTANICFHHGKTKYFSLDGFFIVYNYFYSRGHAVKGFLANYMLQESKVKSPHNDSAKVVNQLKNLCDLGLIVTTPSQDYDDSYIIQYAKTHSGFIVSNDLFRDHIEKAQDKKEVSKWIKEHTISFTFVGNEDRKSVV